ncbi:MAG: hypothetical protein ACRCWR_06890 [Saezia sp.]
MGINSKSIMIIFQIIFLAFICWLFVWPYLYPFFAYSGDFLDFNHDGKVTFSEYFYAVDIGRREIMADDKKCIEYFSLKDASVLKVECE